MDSTQRTRPRTGGSPVGLVVFIILTVVFAVLSYWSFASYQSQIAATKTAEDARKVEESSKRKAQDVIAAFQKVTGAEAADGLKEHTKNLLEAAKSEGFGAADQESTKDALTTGLYALNQQKIHLDTLTSDLSAEQAARKNVGEQKEAQAATYRKEIDEKSAAIQDLQKTLEDQRATMQARIDKEVAEREKLRDQYYTDQDDWRVRFAKSAVKILELQTKLRELSGEDVVLGQASGQIADIDVRSGLVTVNIGANAGVKAGMRLVAFSKDAAGNPVKKGVVEVVKVTEKASAGRVVAEEKGMKVGRNDYVYNLAGPRKKMFVFAGTTKEYPIEMWRNFIEANGGEVVEEVRKGSQVADYLVLCMYDDQKDTKAAQLINEAREFSVKMVKEADLKNLMGLK